jgi:hypothetical protein
MLLKKGSKNARAGFKRKKINSLGTYKEVKDANK